MRIGFTFALAVSAVGLWLRASAAQNAEPSISDEHGPFGYYLARAKNGDPYSMEMVGGAYERGTMGAVQNFREAANWYRKAIKTSGDKDPRVSSMIVLSGMHIHGEGIPRDFVRAYMWYDILNSVPGQQGQWSDVLNASIQAMTPAQIDSAQEMALRCQQSHYQNCGD